MNQELIKALITTGELEIEGRLVDASNATLLAHIKGPNDEQISVIYKPIAGERPLWDFPDGNLASREVAAYEFSENAGFHVVPFTVMRDGPFGPGAVQQWIDVDQESDVVTIAQSDLPAMRKMALFDAIVNNTDRKFGHILVSPDGTIFGCDHGVTFHEDDKLRTVLWQWSGNKLTRDEAIQLERIDSELDDWGLQKYLTTPEILAIHARISKIRECNEFPVPSQEWPAVPWPPF